MLHSIGQKDSKPALSIVNLKMRVYSNISAVSCFLCLASVFRVEVLALAGSDALRSRIQNAQCELLVSVGRIPGSAMPPEWAASGAKLVFPLEVEFTEESPRDFEMTKERLLGDASSSRSVEPLDEPTFVSSRGQETIKVTEGAYGCELQQIEAQQFSFRFFLDFPEGAVRNDVELPAERIFFMSSCWINNGRVLERAKQRKEAIEKSLKNLNEELIQKENEASNLFQKALAFRESITLVEKRESLQKQLAELFQTYPLQPDRLIRGPNDIIFTKEGIIAVKRFRGAMGTREQYHWVGTFSISEFFEDEDDENGNNAEHK